MSALSLVSTSARTPVWRADMLHAGALPQVAASGHAALDAELPGGGWPLDGLVELLQPAAGGAPLWPLLLPGLAARQQGGAVVLVGAPYSPYLPALAAAGLPPERVLWVPDDCPWAAEQALRCTDVAAVLAWLPRVRAAELRRLHLAAAQRGDALLFAVRPAQAAREASPAPLRLRLRLSSDAPDPATGLAPLRVEILKRRGPPLVAPLRLPAQPPALRALLTAGAVGSAACAAAERGGDIHPPPGRPKAGAAPLGGSAACAAAERGGGIPQRTEVRVLPLTTARSVGREEGAHDVDRLAVAA